MVKTLGREAAETERFRARSEQLRDELIQFGRVRAIFDPLMEALPNIGVLAVLLIGTARISSGSLTAGDLVQVAFLFTLLAFPVRAIGWVLSDLPRSVAGWERIQRVLRAGEGFRYGRTADTGGTGAAAVAVREVSYRYDDADEPILRGLSFSTTPGRVIAVVGATGSGKSTIASLLVRLADPTEGRVELDGHDLRSLAHGVLPRSAAMVFQHSFLFDDTIRSNITLGEDGAPGEDGARFDDVAVRAAARLAQADGFIEALPSGYDTVIGERGTSLSGGQRQRIALARALVRRPRLLILDDATSSVDTEVEAAILEGLKGAALPSTIVVVAYRQATIALADEIVFVEAGRVRACGTHAALLATEPAYAHLVTAYERDAAELAGARRAGVETGPDR